MPFKGLFWKTQEVSNELKVHVYPTPLPLNPFLGVHFTVTVDGHLKIGPTAIPCFWKEQYNGLQRFSIFEFQNILINQFSLLLLGDKGIFRKIAFQEFPKYSQKYVQKLASKLVTGLDMKIFNSRYAPGIRAHLFNKKNFELVNDFVIEHDAHSLHILNAVSPAFTCSIALSNFIVSKYLI